MDKKTGHTRFPDGLKKIMQISEVAVTESGVITLTENFQFQQDGTNPNGRPLGLFQPTGSRPMFSGNLEAQSDIAGIRNYLWLDN